MDFYCLFDKAIWPMLEIVLECQYSKFTQQGVRNKES